MKVIIIGGWPAAPRARLDCAGWTNRREIIMVERGPYVSYANCGLPYHVGDVIPKEASLFVANADTFRSQFAVDVQNAVARPITISPDKKTVELRNVATGEVTTESYDKLVLSPGAPSIRPPLPGIDLPGHLRGADRARHAGHPRVDRTRVAVPVRHAPVLRLPDGEAQDPRGGHRRRLHRPRDGGEPRAPRVRGDPGRDGRSDPGAARSRKWRTSSRASSSGMASTSRSATAWPGSSRPPTVRSRCSHEVRQVVSGRHRDPRARRASGHHAGEGRRAGNRRARRDPRRRTHAHERPGHLRRRRRRRSQGLRHRRVESDRARRSGEPPGPHRRRRDRRTRLALPRHARAPRSSGSSARPPPGSAPARRRSSASATPTTRRSTSTRTRTPATTRARRRSR